MFLRIIVSCGLGIFMFVYFCLDALKLKHLNIETHTIQYLSYIPSLETGSIIEFKEPISLKRIDFLKGDSYSELETLRPVVDKVLVIPPKFSSIR